MAKLAVFVTLTAVLFSTITAYQKECIIGPQYWCHSFQNAQDCGALRHCTDTVWQHDGKYAAVQSSTSCDWCQKILENAHKGIQHLANNENLIMTTMSHGCRLFPLSTLSNTCTDTMEKYGTTVASLMKAERYATVCQLMNMCIAQPDTTLAPQSESTTEKPMILGQNRCTWGPAYWCSSLSNSRECKSIEHCSTNVWSQQKIEQQPDDNICKYCQFTIEKLRTIVEEDKVLMSVEKWLSGSCSMLPTKDLIDDCVEMMSKYADEVLALVKAKIDPGVICHLSHMCKDATIKVKAATVEIHDVAKPMVDHQENDEVTNVPFDEESKMLCHVIVRATDELYTKQNRERVEVVKFLAADCQNLPNSQLVEKCEYLVYRYGTEIYAHVASKVDLSKVCDYLDNFVDNSNVQALAPVHCELCQFVLSTSKYMLDANFATDKVIAYIDEQVCNRLNENEKKICRNILAVEGVTLIDGIRAGTKSMLLCTRFQICVDQVFDETNTIPKEDIQSFIKNTLCDKMGNLKDACYAMMEKDSTRLLKTVVQDLEGDVICKLFGVCPKRLTFLDDLAINDDKNQCKRCIDDFTRRKHIAEKLVNHSAEFLHHLCGQLPEKDKCTQAVDDSIQELIDFVRAMDPQDICVQLKMCDSNDLKELTSTVFDPSTISLSVCSL